MNDIQMNDEIKYSFFCPVLASKRKREGKIVFKDSSATCVRWGNGTKHWINQNQTVKIISVNGKDL